MPGPGITITRCEKAKEEVREQEGSKITGYLNDAINT